MALPRTSLRFVVGVARRLGTEFRRFAASPPVPVAAPTGDRSLAGVGRGFSRHRPFVATTVFHWFTPTAGNVRGPWRPLGGRESWTGTADFWIEQIKQMMAANIDAIYVHCINQYEDQRVELFNAYARLRAEGYDPPKIAPFLDPFYLWRESPIDVATSAGKDEFARHYVRFFEQYFRANDDPLASSWLLRIDGKPVLTSWWVYSLLRNLEHLRRGDVEARLRARFGDRFPELANGIYVISTALIDPDLTFADERAIMFSGYAYGIHCVHNGIDSWHVQAGYWDQNIRAPGFFLPRAGGAPYRTTWDQVVANLPNLHRVYVESWNEYDEGSGIYPADPGPPFVDAAMHSNTDVYSDTGDPFEYVRTTARGAASVNGLPDDDAAILACTTPARAQRGAQVEVSVTVRNQGNRSWTGRDGVGLVVLDAGGSAAGGRLLDDRADEIAVYGGVFRGRPMTVQVPLRAPDVAGRWTGSISVVRGGEPFGARATVSIDVD